MNDRIGPGEIKRVRKRLGWGITALKCMVNENTLGGDVDAMDEMVYYTAHKVHNRKGPVGHDIRLWVKDELWRGLNDD